MSDSNISEKLVEKVTEGITNIIKKTIIFEKTERMRGLFIGLAISSSLFGLFTIYNSYQLNNIDKKVNNIDKNLTIIKKVVIDNAHIPRVCYKILSEDYSIFYTMNRKLLDTNKAIDNVNERINNIIALLEDKKVEKDE
jgi:hypothetical protein